MDSLLELKVVGLGEDEETEEEEEDGNMVAKCLACSSVGLPTFAHEVKARPVAPLGSFTAGCKK